MRIAAAVLFLALSACTQEMGIRGHLVGDDPRPGDNQVAFARLPPEHTIARGDTLEPIREPRFTLHLLERGQQRFEIHCSPCHGYAGYGDGQVVHRGFLPPPSYHQDRLRNAPDLHFFNVITYGTGAMYSYAPRVSEADRWAIVAYIRALQLSQNAPVSRLSPQDKADLKRAEL